MAEGRGDRIDVNTINIPETMIKEFHESIRTGDVKCVEVLLKDSADSASALAECVYDELTLLQLAVDSNQIEVCRMLLQSRCDVNATAGSSSQTALHIACSGHVDHSITRLLVDNGADFEALHIIGSRYFHIHVFNRETPLHTILRQFTKKDNFSDPNYFQYINKLKILLEAGASVNTTSINGESPLHRAVTKFHSPGLEPWHDEFIPEEAPCVHAAKMLVERGALVNHASQNNGKTALHLAAESGCDKIMTYLLENGANVKIKEINGYTPLITLSRYATLYFDEDNDNLNSYVQKRVNCLQALLDYGADIDELDTMGDSPMRWLLRLPSPPAVAMLEACLLKNANVNHKNARHETLLHLVGVEIGTMGVYSNKAPVDSSAWRQCVDILTHAVCFARR